MAHLCCRETAAPSDTVRQRWEMRLSATSGKKDTASVLPASFDT